MTKTLTAVTVTVLLAVLVSKATLEMEQFAKVLHKTFKICQNLGSQAENDI